MTKTRRDPKGRALQKGETYVKKKGLYQFAYTDPVGVRRYVYSKNLIELRDKEKEIRRDSLDGIDSYARATCTFDFLFQRYIKTKRNIRDTTRTSYTYTYEHYIKDTLGKKKVGELKFSDINLFYQSQIDKGLSLNTVSNIHKIITGAFSLAVRDDIVRKNPADGALTDIKASIKDRPVRHALTHPEEDAFLDSLDEPRNERWKNIFVFMFGTGCRISEVIGIRWEDIDFDEGFVSINHAIVYGPQEDKAYKCVYRVGPPKTQKSERTIQLFPKVKAALLDERERQDKYGYHNTDVIDGMSGFVFCNRFGSIHKPSGINKVILRIIDDHNGKEIVKAAKEDREPIIIPRFSCHTTRHTFCTRLCECETNIKLIQQTMGHSDSRTTMDIYAEVTQPKARAVFQEISEDDVL